MGKICKFLLVKQYIEDKISSGVYQHEEKLPSIRRLCLALNVSKNTVIRAYQDMDAAGLIYSTPKSGYRVKVPMKIELEQQGPRPIDLLSTSKEILQYPEKKECLATGSAHPNVNSSAIKSLYAEIGRHSRKQSQMPSYYQLPPGNRTLVKQLTKISLELNVETSPKQLAVTHGAQQAISLALRAITKPGDIVAVESPCYFGNLLLLESLGLKVVEITSCIQHGMEPKALERAVTDWPIKAILVTPSFSNPTGSRMPLARRLEILSVSKTIPIIEDDVFAALGYDNNIMPLKTLDKQNRVIYVNSLSKVLDSRLRIGWIIAGQYHSKIEKYLISDNMGSLNLIQSAVGDFLSTGKYRQHVNKMRRVYQYNVRQFSNLLSLALNRYDDLRGGFHLSQPQGSFLIWLTLPKAVDTFELYQECRKNRISILPGKVFTTGKQFRQSVRLSCANFEDTELWKMGINRLALLIHEQVYKARQNQKILCV